MQAIWRGVVVAESNDIVLFEGEHYFPADALKREYTLSSNRRSMCSVKGPATYLTLFVDGDANADAACLYAEPAEGAAAIKGRVVFGRGVQITE